MKLELTEEQLTCIAALCVDARATMIENNFDWNDDDGTGAAFMEKLDGLLRLVKPHLPVEQKAQLAKHEEYYGSVEGES